jgi:hypothetical protein
MPCAVRPLLLCTFNCALLLRTFNFVPLLRTFICAPLLRTFRLRVQPRDSGAREAPGRQHRRPPPSSCRSSTRSTRSHEQIRSSHRHIVRLGRSRGPHSRVCRPARVLPSAQPRLRVYRNATATDGTLFWQRAIQVEYKLVARLNSAMNRTKFEHRASCKHRTTSYRRSNKCSISPPALDLVHSIFILSVLRTSQQENVAG